MPPTTMPSEPVKIGDDVVVIPAKLAHAMFQCYYGTGPRHPSSPIADFQPWTGGRGVLTAPPESSYTLEDHKNAGTPDEQWRPTGRKAGVGAGEADKE